MFFIKKNYKRVFIGVKIVKINKQKILFMIYWKIKRVLSILDCIIKWGVLTYPRSLKDIWNMAQKKSFFKITPSLIQFLLNLEEKNKMDRLKYWLFYFLQKKQLVIFNLCSPYFPNFCQLKIPLFLINTVTLKKHTFLKKEKTSLNRLTNRIVKPFHVLHAIIIYTLLLLCPWRKKTVIQNNS